MLPSCQKEQTGVTEETVQVADTTRQTCHRVWWGLRHLFSGVAMWLKGTSQEQGGWQQCLQCLLISAELGEVGKSPLFPAHWGVPCPGMPLIWRKMNLWRKVMLLLSGALHPADAACLETQPLSERCALSWLVTYCFTAFCSSEFTHFKSNCELHMKTTLAVSPLFPVQTS